MRSRSALRAVANSDARSFHVVLEVPDLTAATAFYAKLFGSAGSRIVLGRVYFQHGSLLLGISDLVASGRDVAPAPRSLDLAVRDLEAFHARARLLRCLVTDHVDGARGDEIVERGWCERSFYVDDPFGNRLCFVDEILLFTGT